MPSRLRRFRGRIVHPRDRPRRQKVDKLIVIRNNDNSIVTLEYGVAAIQEDPRYETTWLVRRLFRAMAKAADEYLADSELTAADRAVMEFLFPGLSRSVPEIAGLYDVSRQHVQVTVNRLVDRGLLVTAPNPRHKRSPLVALSDEGRHCFAEIRRKERDVVEALFADIDETDLDVTRDTLRALLRKLN